MRLRPTILVAVLLAGLALATLGSRGGAARAGERAAPAPAGPAPAAHAFACGGQLQCDAGKTYCETINTDVPALPSNYACRTLPVACRPRPGAPPADCRCFPRGTRGHYCGVTQAGGLPGFYRTTFGGR